jgi:hypothetical protein
LNIISPAANGYGVFTPYPEMMTQVVPLRLESNHAITYSSLRYNFKSISVTAPNEALVTWAAYLASTPRV